MREIYGEFDQRDLKSEIPTANAFFVVIYGLHSTLERLPAPSYKVPCPSMNPRELVDNIRSSPAGLVLFEPEPLRILRRRTLVLNPWYCDFKKFLQALQPSETIRCVESGTHHGEKFDQRDLKAGNSALPTHFFAVITMHET